MRNSQDIFSFSLYFFKGFFDLMKLPRDFPACTHAWTHTNGCGTYSIPSGEYIFFHSIQNKSHKFMYFVYLLFIIEASACFNQGLVDILESRMKEY